jgi:LacI family transcriptional regulator
MARTRDEAVTIKTIADAAKVHPSTVSRALNPDEAAKVSSATVRRIQEIAKSLGYEPNPWARSLRTRRTRTLGLVLPRLTDHVVARMFEGAEDRARELDYQAIAVSTKDDPTVEERVGNLLMERRVDGLIFATSRLNNRFLSRIAARGTPFVLMNRSSGTHPVVRSDDELGGYLATRHLLALGHKRIACVAGPSDISTSTLRLTGYRKAHAEAGIAVNKSLVIHCDFSASSGIAAATQVLSARHRPSAIVAVNDATAIGVAAVARDLGLRIPEDLSIVGHNDDQFAALLSVPLTTVRIPLVDMGRSSVDLLMRCIDGETPTSVVLTPSLIVRSSTAKFAGSR